MRPNYRIDDVDKQILHYLIENTRMPFTEIAKKMEVSAGTIHVRVKKMEDAGIIQGTSLIVDYSRMGHDFVAYVGIMLAKSNKIQLALSQLRQIPNVIVASVVSGKYNIFCKIRAKDTHDAKRVIYTIDEIDGVLRTESMISLGEEINDTTRLLGSIFQ